jgi:hypothetical protein
MVIPDVLGVRNNRRESEEPVGKRGEAVKPFLYDINKIPSHYVVGYPCCRA